METSSLNNDHYDQALFTTEGQIIYHLSIRERTAGEIYDFVNASQSTISRKLARMVDRGLLECRISASDRRMFIYNISERYRQQLQKSPIMRFVLMPE